MRWRYILLLAFLLFLGVLIAFLLAGGSMQETFNDVRLLGSRLPGISSYALASATGTTIPSVSQDYPVLRADNSIPTNLTYTANGESCTIYLDANVAAVRRDISNLPNYKKILIESDHYSKFGWEFSPVDNTSPLASTNINNLNFAANLNVDCSEAMTTRGKIITTPTFTIDLSDLNLEYTEFTYNASNISQETTTRVKKQRTLFI